MPGFDFERTVAHVFEQWGFWAYLALFLAVFVQTANPLGAVIPGNPLLFLVGLLSKSLVSVSLVGVILFVALGAFLGNGAGFLTGRFAGTKLLARPRWQRHQARVQEFFARHGSRAVLLAFFLPFVRCFVPLFAGGSGFEGRQFAITSCFGALAWSATFCSAGFFFGEIPLVRQNLELAVLVIGAVVAVKMAISLRRA